MSLCDRIALLQTGQDLSTNCDIIESLCLEIAKSKSIILNDLPLNSDVKKLKNT